MNQYPTQTRHLVAVDCIIFGFDLLEKELKLLLYKREIEPAKGKWSLAGGFVPADEDLDEAAASVLKRTTGLDSVYLKQSFTYGKSKRDPGARVISVAYYALIAIRDIDSEHTAKNGVHWRSVSKLPDLIFDHGEMLKKAMEDLQSQVKIMPVGFELLPSKFTLVQLQELYEAIYQKKIDRRNFRKKIISMGILEKLDEKEKETSKRGAYYYRFNEESYKRLMRDGFYFNMDVN